MRPPHRHRQGGIFLLGKSVPPRPAWTPPPLRYPSARSRGRRPPRSRGSLIRWWCQTAIRCSNSRPIGTNNRGAIRSRPISSALLSHILPSPASSSRPRCISAARSRRSTSCVHDRARRALRQPGTRRSAWGVARIEDCATERALAEGLSNPRANLMLAFIIRQRHAQYVDGRYVIPGHWLYERIRAEVLGDS